MESFTITQRTTFKSNSIYVCWWKQIAPTINADREIPDISLLLDRAWRNIHWPHRYWWSCLLNRLTFLSRWWKPSYFYAHVWDLYCDIKYTAEKTAPPIFSSHYIWRSCFQSSSDLNNTWLKMKRLLREVAILFFFLFLSLPFTLAFLFASDL